MTARALQLAAADAPTPTVYIHDGEALEIGVAVTELTGRDLTSAQLAIGISGTNTPPTDWATPDITRPGDTPNIRTVYLLTDHTAAPGRFTRWVRVTDGDEVRLVRASRQP